MMLPFSFNSLSKAFLKNDILSIDIGFTNIKVVHARKKHGNILKVLNFGIDNTPGGCIKNGVISDMLPIAVNLKKMIENNGISEKNVKIVISAGSNIISKVIFVSKENGKKIEEAIREEVSKQVPVNIFEQKLFYRLIDNPDGHDKGKCKVLVTAVPNAIIENYIKLVKYLNFKPIAIEIPFSSVARFFSRGVRVLKREERYLATKMEGIEGGSNAVVDLGSETTNLSVLNNGSLEFNRVILSGGRNLDEIIAEKLGERREVAERYKKMYGISSGINTGGEIENTVDICIREYMMELLANIKRSLDFYVERCGGKPVERLFFIGGGAALKGLKYYSQDLLGIPVFTLDMMNFRNVEFEDNLDKEKIRFLINALGIAM